MTSMPASYFTDDALLRRIHREKVVGLSGPRALLMMAAHPVAFEGFFHSTGSLDDPYDRLRRTAEIMDTVAWGEQDDADRMTATVRRMHGRARGVLPVDAGRFPAGTPWAADDPELLLWIIACLVDSAALVYDRYVERLTPAERDAYWADYRVIGRLFGLRDSDMPDGLDGLDRYRRELLEGDRLHVSDWARERAREIVLRPPVPWPARPLLETANFITIALLPDQIRLQYGFSPLPPAIVRKALVAGGAEYVRRAVLPVLPKRLRLRPA
jgi:uncharacterized protein (DUF2236 family)